MSSSTSGSFLIPERRASKPSDPETLFRSLSRRSPHIQHLWAHQADILRKWHALHTDTPDLALELPTGTGKTLIGLLIGEFIRQTKKERVAYLCPNRQLAHQVGVLAKDYSIDARVLVGSQTSYPPNDFNAFNDSSAIAVTTYSGIFNTNPKISSANLLILDDAHASEDFIAPLWTLDIDRTDEPALYYSLIDLFRDVIPGYQVSVLKDENPPYDRSECGKIPSPILQDREAELRDFLDSKCSETDLQYSWRMIRSHLDACHLYITWQSMSIRPVTPPTFIHEPFAQSRQRIYMSATLGEGGELERITGVRKIERLPVPEGWEREGTGRRFIMFPERSLPPEAAKKAAITLVAEPIRSLILAPSRRSAQSISDELRQLSPAPTIVSAHDIEESLEPFSKKKHAALVLTNRYDGLDLPGDICHLEWICGLPGATNAQEAFLLNRLEVHSVLRDRIRTRLTQALGRCTRNATDHAVVIVSGAGALEFCNKNENKSTFHPELQAEIEYGLKASQVQWPQEFVKRARDLFHKAPGWEAVDEWIREERDSYTQANDAVAQMLMANVSDEIDYANALWAGNYQTAFEKARACTDRLSGDTLREYRAWWYYLAASATALSMSNDKAEHLRDTARELFNRACAAAPKVSWFNEVARLVDFDVQIQPIDDPLLLAAAAAVEARIHQLGVAGVKFENEATSLIEQLNSSESTPFEQGLERLGLWLGIQSSKPKSSGVPDTVWTFPGKTVIALEAKSNEQVAGPISLSTAREAQGHIKWVERHCRGR